MSSPLVLLCAGGTGGHLFPAEALATALVEKGIQVDLATDSRAAAYAKSFPAHAIHRIPSETIRSKSPLALVRTVWTLAHGCGTAYALLGRLRPQVVVGFGGYPTLPPLLAASWRGIPTLVHEQNAVMGRANRLLARRVSRIATGFPTVLAVPSEARGKLVHTGNPVRPAVIEAARKAYPTFEGQLRVLVFGGSQGARVMSDIVPDALSRLDSDVKSRLAISQQAREEDLERVARSYKASNIDAEIAPFFSNLPERMAASHLVIGRGGASTVAELAVIGRPSILVPLPGALDQDQAANAKALEAAGAAYLIHQKDFTADSLADLLQKLLRDPESLAAHALAAKALGTPDAAQRLAAQVEELIATRDKG